MVGNFRHRLVRSVCYIETYHDYHDLACDFTCLVITHLNSSGISDLGEDNMANGLPVARPLLGGWLNI